MRAIFDFAPWPAALVAVLLVGCERDTTGPVVPPPPVVPVTLTATLYNSLYPVVTGQDCTAAEELDPDSALFHTPLASLWFGGCTPTSVTALTAPDGRQLTAREWVNASGEVTITCVDEGTRYDFRLQGLVPGGIYTIWHAPPPPHGSYGALASHPGDIRNVFTATLSGAVDFSVTGTAGSMTVNGFVPACILPMATRAQLGRSWEVFWVEFQKDGRAGDEKPSESAVGHLLFEIR